jgi:Fic family protein
MAWNWQLAGWPCFEFTTEVFKDVERDFLLNSGVFRGSVKHLDADGVETLRVELLSQEAMQTSQIEGEMLNRDSVQSSIRRALGLHRVARRVHPSERGIAEMTVDVYRNFGQDLSHETLFSWHRLVMRGRGDLESLGEYRIHEDPMQIVSGPMGMERVHFEAPPSCAVLDEMERFVQWFNASRRDMSDHPLLRAGLAHLYFESIHPFEDGNGRIGRALVEMVLSQHLGQPVLLALSSVIESDKRAYYQALHTHSQTLQVNDWLGYFCKTVLEAQLLSQSMVDFIIQKAAFYQAFAVNMNTRQSKVVERMFRAGVKGFAGGLSAKNYVRIANTSASTATRDLQDLVSLGALSKTGELKGTRYHLNLASLRRH